jgi:hypothetical protein
MGFQELQSELHEQVRFISYAGGMKWLAVGVLLAISS